MLLRLLLLAASLFLATAASAQNAEDKAAREHFNSGRAYFERAEYDDAVREFEAAYRLSQRPPLLINISKAHESAGRPAEAAEALERWQQVAAADDPLRTEVDARLRRLRAQAERQAQASEAPSQATETAPPPEAAPEAPAEHKSQLGPWIVMGTGLALTGTGVVLAILGKSDIDKVEHPSSDATWDDVKDPADRGPRRATIGLTLAGVGVAALGTGIAWYFVGRRSETQRNARLELTPMGMRVQGRF